MKVTVTKHTAIKLSRKEIDTFLADKLSEIYTDLDKIEIVYDTGDNGNVIGATAYSREEE